SPVLPHEPEELCPFFLPPPALSCRDSYPRSFSPHRLCACALWQFLFSHASVRRCALGRLHMPMKAPSPTHPRSCGMGQLWRFRVAPGVAPVRHLTRSLLIALYHTERPLNPHEIRASSLSF